MKKGFVLCVVLLLLSFGAGVSADVGVYDWEISRECDYDRYVATTDGGVNLRTEPSTNGAILCTVPDFVMLHISSESTDGWGYTNYNGEYGWVALSQLSSSYPTSETNRTVVVSASDGVNLREGPDVSYAKVRSAIPAGEVLTVTSIYSKKNWGYVTYDGVSGWIALSEVSAYDAAAAAAEQAQEEAVAEELEEAEEAEEEVEESDVVLLDPDEGENQNSSFLFIVIALVAIAVVITAAILLIILLSKSTKNKMRG